jgi:hypothetical protein
MVVPESRMAKFLSGEAVENADSINIILASPTCSLPRFILKKPSSGSSLAGFNCYFDF